MKHLLKFITVLCFIFCLAASPAYAKVDDSPIKLDLKDVEIFSASKEKEPTFKAAASVYVLSSDDIRCKKIWSY